MLKKCMLCCKGTKLRLQEIIEKNLAAKITARTTEISKQAL